MEYLSPFLLLAPMKRGTFRHFNACRYRTTFDNNTNNYRYMVGRVSRRCRHCLCCTIFGSCTVTFDVQSAHYRAVNYLSIVNTEITTCFNCRASVAQPIKNVTEVVRAGGIMPISSEMSSACRRLLNDSPVFAG